MRHSLLIAACLFAGAGHAAAAELRNFTTLQSGVVRLSDLFDDAGDHADRVLGPGPAPGGQIVVEAAQLAAIARQFDVDWRPSSNADRAVLDRPGRPLPREAVMDALRDGLAGTGMSGDADIELPTWDPPMVPVGALVHPDIGQLDYDAGTGKFTAVLTIATDGMAPMHVRVAGEVREMMTVPVPVRRLLPGDVIGPQDLHMVRVHATDMQGAIARLPAQAIGLAVRHPAMPGQPLRVADLMPPPLVQKGGLVSITLDEPGMSLTAQGQALDQGAMGEHVRVMNPSSHAVLDAEIIGENAVRVLPGSAPLPANARMNQVAFR